jgi:hypothetical protein
MLSMVVPPHGPPNQRHQALASCARAALGDAGAHSQPLARTPSRRILTGYDRRQPPRPTLTKASFTLIEQRRGKPDTASL